MKKVSLRERSSEGTSFRVLVRREGHDLKCGDLRLLRRLGYLRSGGYVANDRSLGHTKRFYNKYTNYWKSA